VGIIYTAEYHTSLNCIALRFVSLLHLSKREHLDFFFRPVCSGSKVIDLYLRVLGSNLECVRGYSYWVS